MEDDYKTLGNQLKKATDEVKKVAEDLEKGRKNLGKQAEEMKVAADKSLLEMNTLKIRLEEVEQKSARGGTGALGRALTVGQAFVESEEGRSILANGFSWNGTKTVRIDMKTITTASGTGASGSTALVSADRQPGIVQLPDRPLLIRDLLMPGNTESGTIDYVKETGFSNAADFVAENPSAPKPESDITFELVNQPVRDIAHIMRASRQILADAPQLASYIDYRLRYGLNFKEDAALLNGDGTGSSLSGLLKNSTPYQQPGGIAIKGETLLDRLRLAMLQATLAEYPATGNILNPIDWINIELTKDQFGRYLFANPQGVAGKIMWGLPVVDSLAMKQGTFMTGAFKFAAQIFDREETNIMISTEDRDNFVKNMVTIRGEKRLALCVYRPEALINGKTDGLPVTDITPPADPSSGSDGQK